MSKYHIVGNHMSRLLYKNLEILFERPSQHSVLGHHWPASQKQKCLLGCFYLFFRQDTFDLNPIGNPVYDTYKVSQAPKVSFQKRGFLAQAVFAGKPSFTGISTIGLRRKKTCLQVSDKMRFKAICSATEIS